jgi:hypothetical protein
VSNSTNRHQELKAILDRLKLSGMAKHFPELALRATKEGLSHEAYLHEPSLGKRKPYAKSGAQNGCYELQVYRWRKPSAP